MSTDGQASDPRASLSAAIGRSPAPAASRTMLDGVLAAADAGSRRPWARSSSPTRTAPASSSSASMAWTTRRSAGWRPTSTTRPIRSRRPPSRGPRPSTARRRRLTVAFIGAYLPLVVASGGVDVVARVDRVRLAGPARARRDRAGNADRAGIGGGAGRRSTRLGLDCRRAIRMVRADGTHGSADRPRQRAHRRPRPRARAGTRRSPGQRGLVRDVRRGRLPGDEQEGGHEAGDDVLRRVASVLAESVRLVDTVGRIGGDEFVLVAPGSAGAMVARRILDGIAALPPVGGRQITVSVGVARFPADGTDAAALIAAATDGLTRARAEGRGSIASGVVSDE